MFENVKEDWRIHRGPTSPVGFYILLVYRFGVWRYTIKNPILRKPLSVLYKVLRRVSETIFTVELPCETRTGRRLVLEHPFAIVVSGDAVLGDDVVLRSCVTIGLRHPKHRGSPNIGNRVDIGSGAKLLGPITIGDDVSIGANAVVITDVPAGHIAVGVPAKIRPRSDMN